MNDRALVLTSLKAGIISFAASWAACYLFSFGIFALPGWNASLGVVTTIVTYITSFYFFSHLPLPVCIKTLGIKELCENALRFALHYGLMHYGWTALEAAPVAQFISGGLGHVSTPLFFRFSEVE